MNPSVALSAVLSPPQQRNMKPMQKQQNSKGGRLSLVAQLTPKCAFCGKPVGDGLCINIQSDEHIFFCCDDHVDGWVRDQDLPEG
jgi:hypothetical protein